MNEKHLVAENMVVQNEKLFKALIEKSTDMITLSTLEGELLYGSPSITQQFGYTFEEFKNKSALEFIHPDDIQAFIENRIIIANTPGTSFYYKQRLLHKNGTWKWCEGTDTNMLNEPGIHAIVSNFRDISEKKLAEEGLLLTQLAIDNAGDAVFWMTPEARIVRVNEAACIMLGYTRQEIVGLSIPDIDPYYNAAKWPVHFAELHEKGSLFFESLQQTKDGRLIPVEIRANYIKFDAAEFNCAFIRDISERKLAEKNLLESESRLKEAQAIAHIGNFEIDLSNHTEIWSDEMYKITGVIKGEVFPSTELLLSFICREDFNDVQNGFTNCIKSLQNATFNFRFIRNDGANRYGCIEVRFEFDKNKKPIRLFGIFQDVTNSKLAEAERKKMVTDLVLRNTELEQFAYIVSHNLRAPVANIIGATSALNDPELSTEDKNMLNRGINVSVMKLDDVVKDLNHILEVKAEINETKEVVHFSELVDDIKISIDDLTAKYRIEIKYDFSEANELLTLKPYLYSVFYNLILNSVKYRRHDAHTIIEIKSRLIKNSLELTFTDNGIGIDLKKSGGDVFGLYKRFHTNVEGKGMGLFMVKTQVEMLSGKISLKSAENQGSEFKIEFDLG